MRRHWPVAYEAIPVRESHATYLAHRSHLQPTMIEHRRSAATVFLSIIALFCWLPSTLGAESPGKAIVLAWDGTVPAFVQEMLRDGKLPNLAKLIEGGAFADDVVPVFPSKTAPGFASLITGAPPRITGISGNRVPRAPRGQFTILESLAGFSAAPLRAEPIWSAAQRAGRKAVVSHIPTFAGEPADQTVRFSGYTLIVGRDGIITKNNSQSSAAHGVWRNSPPSDAMPIDISFAVAGSKFFGLFIDDPNDVQLGYDTLVLATARDGEATVVKLKTAPAGVGGELFWSQPLALKTPDNQDAKAYFRLFDLKPDGSDFFLYYTRPVRDLPIETQAETAPSPTVLSFVGNGATILFQQGAFGRTILNGGNGGAEERYLETVAFAQHQLMETNRWALDHLPWDLFLAYTPFPDEAEHHWRGYLDATVPTYNKGLAERIRPLLERAYQTSDEHLGLLLSKRPGNALFALISDHGLQGIYKRVALNQVLQQAGLLALDAQGRVDLSKTKALYPTINNGYLLINSKDRKSGIVGSDERVDLVDKIRETFLALHDGEQPIVRAVYDAELNGRAMGIGGEVGGDIYIELAPGYDFDPRIAPGALLSETQPYGTHGTNPEQAAIRTLMVFNGPGIRAGQKLTNVHLIDFAPTLAWLLGFPKPKEAVGRVLFDALDSPR
jgi:predicted AlkP superfamily phosphohydrolase/phosphomutase